MKRIDSDFISHGVRCAAWLFLPEAKNPPVVVMAHGFGAERTFRLPAFAEKFCAAGLAVFLFDYRGFGDSDGEPRNLISPPMHLEDWKTAIDHVRARPEVNAQKIALWGSSFSGGHVLVTAATVPGISAVVAQVPFVDGVATAMRYPFLFQLKGTAHGLLDLLTIISGRPPHHVPIVGKPDEFALMNTPECWPGVMSILPPNQVMKNFAPARIALTLPLYRPINYAANIPCPVMIVRAEKDSLIPPEAVGKTAAKIKNVKLVSLPVGHFEVYTGELFEKVSALEAGFLAQNLISL